MRVSPATVSCGKSAGAGQPRPVAAAVAATEELVAAADGEQRDALRRCAARIASPCAARSGAISACSRSWPPPT